MIRTLAIPSWWRKAKGSRPRWSHSNSCTKIRDIVYWPISCRQCPCQPSTIHQASWWVSARQWTGSRQFLLGDLQTVSLRTLRNIAWRRRASKSLNNQTWVALALSTLKACTTPCPPTLAWTCATSRGRSLVEDQMSKYRGFSRSQVFLLKYTTKTVQAQSLTVLQCCESQELIK